MFFGVSVAEISKTQYPNQKNIKKSFPSSLSGYVNSIRIINVYSNPEKNG